MMAQGIDTLDKWKALTVADLEKMDGFTAGGSKAKGIVEGIEKALPTAEALLAAGVTIVDHTPTTSATGGNGNLSGTFCFTGKLPSGMKRKEAEQIVLENGGTCRSVSTKLDYLVIADPNSQSSKAKKARDLGIKLISEEEFQGMI